jgi:hypothetical protein
MKSLRAIAIAAALLAGAMPVSAQNSTPTTKVSPSPSNINKSNAPAKPSGAEAPSTAAGRHAHVTGKGKFCKPNSGNRLSCLYASARSCQLGNKANSLHCVANPNLGRKF